MTSHPRRVLWPVFPFLITLSIAVFSCGSDDSTTNAQAGSPPAAATPVVATASPTATPTITPGASATPSPSATVAAVTFSQVNQNVIQPNCVSCHSGASAPNGVDLSSFAGVSSQVVAGDPQSSRLYQVIANGSMPPTGALSQAQVQQVSDWITAGAKND